MELEFIKNLRENHPEEFREAANDIFKKFWYSMFANKDIPYIEKEIENRYSDHGCEILEIVKSIITMDGDLDQCIEEIDKQAAMYNHYLDIINSDITLPIMKGTIPSIDCFNPGSRENIYFCQGAAIGLIMGFKLKCWNILYMNPYKKEKED